VREVSEETSSISQTTATQIISGQTSNVAYYDGTSSENLTGSLNFVKNPKSLIKLFINGVRISNAAVTYNSSDQTVTYVSSANHDYYIKLGDRVQIDYYY
jgi:hypothetical protein